MILEKIAALDPKDFGRQMDLMKCYLALKDYPSYRRVCEAGVAQHGKSQVPNMANNAIWHTALIPNAVRNYTETIEIGRKIAGSRNTTANEHNTFGAVLYRAGQYSSSLTFLRKSIDADRCNLWAYFILAACLAHLGRLDEARQEIRAGLAVNPKFTLRRFRTGVESDNAVFLAQRERLIDGLRKAGLPEE